MDILDVARRNQQKAWEIIEKVNVIPIWESIGAQVNRLVLFVWGC